MNKTLYILVVIFLLFSITNVNAATLNEDFNYPDSTNITPNWIEAPFDTYEFSEKKLLQTSAKNTNYNNFDGDGNISWRIWKYGDNFTSDDFRFLLLFNVQNKTDTNINNEYGYYGLHFKPKYGAVELYKYNLSTTQIGATAFSISLTNGTKIGFNSSTVGTGLKMYVNDTLAHEFNAGDDSYSGGSVGIGGTLIPTTDYMLFSNLSIVYEESLSPSITSSSPATPTTSFVNESKTFNADSDQSGNWAWYIDSILMKSSETGTPNATYINSTALNGTTYNVTAIITNSNGTAQTSWDWTALMNYIITNVTYMDGSNTTIATIFNVSYVSNGTTQWGFNLSWTDANQQYDWTYINGTIIQSLTATSTNQTLEFLQPTKPIGIYYIQKASTTIETFVVPATAFATVVFVATAGIFRISSWINRRRRRSRR